MEIAVASKDESNSLFDYLQGSNESSVFLERMVEKHVDTVKMCPKIKCSDFENVNKIMDIVTEKGVYTLLDMLIE